jgi:hypothetical protein
MKCPTLRARRIGPVRSPQAIGVLMACAPRQRRAGPALRALHQAKGIAMNWIFALFGPVASVLSAAALDLTGHCRARAAGATAARPVRVARHSHRYRHRSRPAGARPGRWRTATPAAAPARPLGRWPPRRLTGGNGSGPSRTVRASRATDSAVEIHPRKCRRSARRWSRASHRERR